MDVKNEESNHARGRGDPRGGVLRKKRRNDDDDDDEALFFERFDMRARVVVRSLWWCTLFFFSFSSLLGCL